MPSRHADWLLQAERDLTHARHSLETEDFEWACFAAHHAVEKAVKAVFQHLGTQVIGHSVRDMLAELGRTLEVSAQLVDCGRMLDRDTTSQRGIPMHIHPERPLSITLKQKHRRR